MQEINERVVWIVGIVCATILGIAMVVGGVCCQTAEYEYHYKLQELNKQR